MDAKEKASELLIHYFRLIAKHTDIRWTEDNDAEIGAFVDLLVEAAQEEIKEGIKQ